MNTLPAQEVKRRGVAAFDEKIGDGPIHIIRRNRPEYVVLTQERYDDLVQTLRSDYEERVLASYEDYKAGRVWRGTAEELIQALQLED